MKFLSYDSPFMTAWRLLVDYILLGLLWVLACLPVITFGAATTAMLFTAETSLRKEEGKMFTTFWKCFRKEFKEATILWFVQMLLLVILAANVWLGIFMFSGLLRVLLIAMVAVAFTWMQLWFAYLSKFEDNVKTVLGNTFRIMMGNLGRTLLMSLVIAAAVAAAVALLLLKPPVMVLVPGIFILFYTAIMRKLFDKYIPKESTLPSDEAE